MKANSSLVPRLHSPAFYRTVYKSGATKIWGVESGNEASYLYDVSLGNATAFFPSSCKSGMARYEAKRMANAEIKFSFLPHGCALSYIPVRVEV